MKSCEEIVSQSCHAGSRSRLTPTALLRCLGAPYETIVCYKIKRTTMDTQIRDRFSRHLDDGEGPMESSRRPLRRSAHEDHRT